LRYLAQVGGQIEITAFDEDHEPGGPALRADLVRDGLAAEGDGRIALRACEPPPAP
jgi:hypothetical protein